MDRAYKNLFAAIFESAIDDVVDYYTACLAEDPLGGSLIYNYRTAKRYIDAREYAAFLDLSLSPMDVYRLCLRKAVGKCQTRVTQQMRYLAHHTENSSKEKLENAQRISKRMDTLSRLCVGA